MRVVKVLLVLLLATATSAQALPIVQHQGDTNPASEGWTLYNPSYGSVLAGTETTSSGAWDYWQISHPSTAIPPNYYRYGLSSTDLEGDWCFSAWVRVVDSRGHRYYSSHIPMGDLLIRDDYSTWGLMLGNDIVGIMNSAVVFSRSHQMDTRDDYHHYELFFHQNNPGYADDTVSYKIDGTTVFSDVTRAEVQNISSYSGSLRGVLIGSGSSGAYTVINYSDLELDASVPVPEPSTLGLFFSGLLFLVLSTRKRIIR